MYEEFFNYIATRIIGYFEQECDNLHDGDRFCFKLDAYAGPKRHLDRW